MYQFPENQQFDNDEYSMAANLIRCTNRSFYLTGKPGTGKTAFLEQAARQSGKNFLYLSPSNETAFTSGGATIHSFFHLPYSPFLGESFTDAQRQVFYNYKKEKRKIIEKTDLIIIDDIAAVRADTIDAIDFRLRHFGGKRNLPFGGKQVVLAGDSFQLTELATSDEWELLKKTYDTPYFFSSRVLLKADLLAIEFRKPVQGQDDLLGGLLNKIRRKQMLLQDVEQLNACYVPDFSPSEQDNYVTLTADKHAADNINFNRLGELGGPLHTYTGKLKGRFVREANDDLLPAPEVLELKENAQVIFVKDDPAGRWSKGTVARVWALTHESVTVTIDEEGGKLCQVEIASWHNHRYEADAAGAITTVEVGSFTQFPLRLGWAISIQKSRGLSFKNIIINDCKDEAGSAYIALSRCSSFEAIKMKAPLSHAQILVRDEVVRLSLAANNDRLIRDAMMNGQADQLYRQCVQAFNNGDFELAVADLTKAISLRNDTLNPSFKRLMAIKLKGLKTVQQQAALFQQQFAPLVTESPALAGAVAANQPPAGDPALLQQLESTKQQTAQLAAELSAAKQQLDVAMQELVAAREGLEAGVTAVQSGALQHATAIERLERTTTNIAYQIADQQQELTHAREALTALNDASSNGDTDNKKALKFWADLNSQLVKIETDIAKWKTMVIIGGISICVLITIMLFVSLK